MPKVDWCLEEGCFNKPMSHDTLLHSHAITGFPWNWEFEFSIFQTGKTISLKLISGSGGTSSFFVLKKHGEILNHRRL